jgi:hypothetical protein
LACHLKRVRAALQQTEVLVRTAIPSGSWLALTLVIASLPAVALAQVDQQALARAILGDDRRAAQEAFDEATRALAPEEMGPELRAALIAALERQNQVYRATAEAAVARDASGFSPPKLDRLGREFWGEGYGFLVETVISLQDREAIPALAGALLSATSLVVQPLVELGEEAAPSVLLIAEGEAWRRSQVEGALAVLTRMIEDPTGPPLSEATRARVRRLVRAQLTTGVEYPGMVLDAPFQRASSLREASSLALALGDPPLRELVASLARDPEAVRRLGVQDSALVAQVQRNAAEALARPPRRR